MSNRQGLWQRLCGASLAILFVLAMEGILPSTPSSANAQTSKIGAKAASPQLVNNLTPREAKSFIYITKCRIFQGDEICSKRKVEVKAPLADPTSTAPASDSPNYTYTLTIPSFVRGEFGSKTAETVIDDMLASLPGVIFVPQAPVTTTTTTRPPTTTTAPPTTTTTRAPTTTTTPPAGTPGPSNRSILVNSGPITITQDGAVVQNVNVTGQITVAANNVTIRNFRANNVYKNPGKSGLLMEYGDLHGEQNDSADGVVWSDYTARFLNVSNLFDAFKAHGNVLIENCWVHDLKFKTGPSAGAGGYTHNDGVQVSSGNNVTVRNSIFERNLGNSAIFIDADQGAISNVLIEGNRLGGGGFTLYSIQSRSAPQFGRPSNVTIRNNVFTEEHHYDYATIAATGTTWTNNKNLSGATITSRIDNY